MINDCWKELIHIELRFKLLKDIFFKIKVKTLI